MKITKKKVKAYALKNAIAYKGKANPGAVISSLFNEGLKKEEVKDYAKTVSEILDEVNSLSLEEQEKQFETFIIKEKQFSEIAFRKIDERRP